MKDDDPAAPPYLELNPTLRQDDGKKQIYDRMNLALLGDGEFLEDDITFFNNKLNLGALFRECQILDIFEL